jgi:Predicted transcriptional regulator
MKEVLSKQEWVIMETLWNHSPMFLSQIMERMANMVDWNSSSFLTYLKRMTDKGYLGFDTISGNRCYYPVIRRDDCIESESDYVLSKLTEQSARLFLASMIQKSGLSEKDREALQALIARLDGDSDREE